MFLDLHAISLQMWLHYILHHRILYLHVIYKPFTQYGHTLFATFCYYSKLVSSQYISLYVHVHVGIHQCLLMLWMSLLLYKPFVSPFSCIAIYIHVHTCMCAIWFELFTYLNYEWSSLISSPFIHFCIILY